MNAGPPPLDGILETVVYCGPDTEADVKRFYRDTLGLKEVLEGFAYRLGSHLLLLFNVEESSVQDDPPPHGARGPGHTCFRTGGEHYEGWKEYLQERDIEITRELSWGNGTRSFYFEDPAGNVLEISDGDMWPP